MDTISSPKPADSEFANPEFANPETTLPEALNADPGDDPGMDQGADQGIGAPIALTDLIAAGLVTHEMIGDPALLGAEAPALDRLCALVSGAIYRIGPFHYAFRAGAADMGGALAELPADAWAGALEIALRDELGADSVWLSATDLLSDALALEAGADLGAGPEAGDGIGGCAPEGPLALLRLRQSVAEAALETAPEGLRAVIDAAYASETARLTAARLGEETRTVAGEISRAIARDVTREVVGEVLGGLTTEIIARATEAAGVAAREAAREAAMEAAREAAREAAMDAAREATETVLQAATRAASEAAAEAAGQAEERAAPAAEAIAARIDALEARLETRLEAGLARREAPLSEIEPRLARIEAALEALLARADLGEARHDLLEEHLGEHLAEQLTLRLGDSLGGRIETGFGARAGASADFEENIGLALAEFLARIERMVAEPARRPH